MNTYSHEEDVEKILKSEIYEKKQMLSGSRCRASRKKGFRGEVRFEHDNVGKRELKKQALIGEVVKYNMYDNINNLMDLSRFRLMDKDDKRVTLSNYLEHHSVDAIAKYWGVEKTVVYGIKTNLKISSKQELSEEEKERILNTDGMISFEDYKKLDKQNKKLILLKYLKEYGGRVNLAKTWGVKYHNVVDQLKVLKLVYNDDIPKIDIKTEKKEVLKLQDTTKQTKERKVRNTMAKPKNVVVETVPTKTNSNIDVDESRVTLFKKDITGEELHNRLLKIADYLEKDKKYEFTISMKELD